MLIGPLGLTGDILQPVFAPTERRTPNPRGRHLWYLVIDGLDFFVF